MVLQEHHATGQAEEMDRLKKLLATLEAEKEKKDDRKEKKDDRKEKKDDRKDRQGHKRELMDEATAFQEPPPKKAKDKGKEKEADKSKGKKVADT